MTLNFTLAREALSKAIDSLMLPDDTNEGVADAFHELSVALTHTDETELQSQEVSELLVKLRDYADTSACTWVSRRYLEKAQTLSKLEKREFCRSLVLLYTTLETQWDANSAA